MQLLPLSPDNPFPRLFTQAKNQAFHCEMRDSYLVDDEAEALRRFMAGEPPLTERPGPWQAWRDLMRDTTQRGVAVRRVRVVTVPHSDYVQWLLQITADGELGSYENIRWLPRHLLDPELLSLDDWWLFDNHLLAYNLVNGEGAPAGLAATEDPMVVSAYCSARDRLWEKAIPNVQYASSERAVLK